MLLQRIATCISYSADSCLPAIPHIGIILLMIASYHSVTSEGLAGIKRLILLLYIWLDVAVKPLKYVLHSMAMVMIPQ